VPNRELQAGRRTEYTLTTDDPVSMTTDGTSVYYIESGGSIRWLPIP